MKNLLILIAMVISSNAMAYETAAQYQPRQQKASKADYIRDYGTRCGLAEMDNYEKLRGRLPTDEEMDAILDACVNPKFKKES